jgi:hypothetical protein
VGNGLLKGDAPRCGIERDVRQANLFNATIVTDTEIDTFCRAQVRGMAPNEDVVLRRHGTPDAASRGRPVFTNTQAFLRGALEKRIAYYSQRSSARQVPDSLRERDHFSKPCAALVAA